MEFNGQYLSYSDYTTLGGQLTSEMPFNLFELEARTYIDNATMYRLQNLDEEDIPDQVKLCDFNLIETLAFKGNYLDSNTDEKQRVINNVINSHLQNVVVDNMPILYRGI